MPDAPILYSATQRYRPLLDALADAGVDVEAVVAEVGFTTAALLDPTHRIPRERAVALFRHLLLRSANPEVGLEAARRFRLPDLGVLGYLLRHAPHALGALELLSDYARLLADAAVCEVTCARGEVRILASLSGGRAFHPLGVDYTIGTIVRMIDELTASSAQPLEVHLARPRPPRVEPYRQLFGPGVRFETSEIVLRYDERALRTPSPESDPQLVAILEQHARDVLARLPGTSVFSEQLRSVVERQVARGERSVRAAADELKLSERTLRRRLAESGRSYRDVLDEVRREHALSLLGEGRHSITDIAQRLGFADATAFTRCFRRWTGHNPSALNEARRRRAG